VVAALAFDFTNGFHDTANAMATSIATEALRPRVAVGLAAVMNFIGAFLSIRVATTIATGIVDANALSLTIVFAALIGAIAWNLVTWALKLPSSSSHALVGGVVGAAIAGIGSGAVKGDTLVEKVIVPALLSPFIAGLVAIAGTLFAYLIVARLREGEARHGYRLGQIGSASLVSLAHGTNDAQKTMGIITLALIAHGNVDADHFSVPLWVKVSCGERPRPRARRGGRGRPAAARPGAGMIPASSLIDFDAPWKIVVAGFAGGAGVVLAFGFVLVGRARYQDAGEGALSRGAYLLLAVVGSMVCAGALIIGFIAMTKK
jgi:phosphate/sulfate permease